MLKQSFIQLLRMLISWDGMIFTIKLSIVLGIAKLILSCAGIMLFGCLTIVFSRGRRNNAST
jgi:hypothetical protein